MFVDRADAGRRLAEYLGALEAGAAHDRPVVLGLPRGGVAVAYEVARTLGAPLDVIIVRKLGVPSQPELAMGALGEDGVMVVNEEVLRIARITAEQLDEVAAREGVELSRRAARYRGTRERVPIDGRTAIVVDDGIATGSTARAACQVARADGAARVVLAAPVAPPDVVRRLHGDADEVVVLEMPARFHAIGQFYRDFSQTSDDEVVRLLSALS